MCKYCDKKECRCSLKLEWLTQVLESHLIGPTPPRIALDALRGAVARIANRKGMYAGEAHELGALLNEEYLNK
jgi:hypothetical protein